MEFIEDIQQCPNCDSDKIEIIPIEDRNPVERIDPILRERIANRRMFVIGVIGIILIPLGLFTGLIPIIGVGAVMFLIAMLYWYAGK